LVIFQTGLGQNWDEENLTFSRRYFSFGSIIYNAQFSVLWFAAGMLWIMDASINVSMEPFRAFVGDNLPENNVPWDLPCKVFLSGLALLRIKTTVNLLRVQNTAPLGVIQIQLNTPFTWVELYLLPFYGR
jgi:maltose/moltooligosaccharide transporter